MTDTSASAERIDNLYQIGEVGSITIGAAAAKDPPPLPEPELRLPQHAIVGRSALVAGVLADLQAGVQDLAFEFLPGIGKTTVAAELIREKALRDLFDGVLWAHLGQTPDVRGELLKWAAAVGLDDSAVAKRKTDAELSRAIESRIGERKLLLVVDDVWSSEAGQYFLLGGPRCTRVLTSRQRGVARELSPQARVYVVPKLAPNDSLTLLRALAPVAAQAEPDALALLAGLVDGMPLALVLLGKMLRNHEDDEAPVQSLLASLRDTHTMFAQKKPLEYAEDQNYTLAEVVEAGYRQLDCPALLNGDQVDGQMLRDAAAALAALRPDPVWFNEALAQQVAGVSPAALRQLAQAGMLERKPSAKDGRMRYTMHRVIAEYLREKLAPEQLQALNERAAQYYLGRLHALEAASQKATAYLALYRYENREWREAQDNWLYHFAQAGYQRASSLAFLNAWFTAFWWWSCFTSEGFDFCDQLLSEWDHRLALSVPEAGGSAPLAAQSDERVTRLREGLDLLRRFKLAYPKETEDRHSPRWAEVEAVLQELRRRMHLDAEVPGADEPDACTVRGLTDIFLAEAARFGRQAYAEAEVLYRDALTVFAAAGDDWTRAWVLYHLADMLSSTGQPVPARALCDEALALGERERDPEVLALLHRVLGDLDDATGAAPAEAALHYAQAVQWAYRFQVEPEAPDAYTVAFYPGIAQAVAERLLRAHTTEPEAADAMLQAVRAPWAAALPGRADAHPFEQAATPQALAQALFPAPLPVERLAADGEAYALAVTHTLALLPAGQRPS